MPDEIENKPDEVGKIAGNHYTRTEIPSLEELQPWKIISQNNIYIIYLSIFLFAVYAIARHEFNWIALSTSLFVSIPIGFAIAYFETRSQAFRRRHRQTQFWFYLLFKTFRVVVWFMVLFFFIMVLIIWLNFNTYETIFPYSLYDFFATRKVFEFLALALGISVFSNFMDELHRKLGGDAIYNLIFGKYHQVKQEDRLFLFVDLNDSTLIAEEMGEMEYSHFLQDYFYDISEPIARYFGRIYQYVGDEAVITWPLKKGVKFAVAVRCFFAIQKQIRRYSKYYQERYNRVPEFKAALHGGTVVVSEVGKYKSEIAYHGDVLNTTARMLNKCHELASAFLISEWVLEQVEVPNYLKTDAMGSYELKGKQQEMSLHSVYLSASKDAMKQKRKRFFIKRNREKAKS